MPTFTVNLSDVESFEPMPEDEYAVEVEKVEVRENKAGDGLYLNWELVVIDGDYENRRLWYITSLKDAALFRLKQTFVGLGLIEDDDDELELEYDDDIDPTSQEGPVLLYPELEGLECVAVVKNEMYEGRERNRVQELFGEETRKPKPKKKSRSAKTTRNSAKASRSTRSTGRSSRNGREEDDDDEDEDDDYEEERPARRRATASRTASSSGRRAGRRRIR